MRFRFIEDRRVDYPVRIMCEVLDVSRAGYYAWRSRPESARSAENRELLEDIQQIHSDNRGRYGSPRIHVELKAQGRGVSRGRVERLMRRHGIHAIMARPRRARTTDSRHGHPIAPNLIERDFVAAAPNLVWLADITYIDTDQGWLYLAAVMDLYSRKIVGWAMQDHLGAELPLTALRMAISAQRPGAGLIHHSDRGVQYASADSDRSWRCSPRSATPQNTSSTLCLMVLQANLASAGLRAVLTRQQSAMLLRHPRTSLLGFWAQSSPVRPQASWPRPQGLQAHQSPYPVQTIWCYPPADTA